MNHEFPLLILHLQLPPLQPASHYFPIIFFLLKKICFGVPWWLIRLRIWCCHCGDRFSPWHLGTPACHGHDQKYISIYVCVFFQFYWEITDILHHDENTYDSLSLLVFFFFPAMPAGLETTRELPGFTLLTTFLMYYVVHYNPSTYLPQNWKFVPFHHLHPIPPPTQILPLIT